LSKQIGLIKILKEQFTFGFTGRVNALLGKNDQYLGAVFQKEGQIIHSEYQGIVGKKALYKMIFDDIDGEKELKFLIEPEIISASLQTFEYTFDQLYERTKKRYPLYQRTKKYRPLDTLCLEVNLPFISHGEEILPEEFDILCKIVESPQVGEIYLKSKLYDYEITDYLVSLRKKKALKVIGPR
jgi:hypothetical protein